MGIKTLAPLHRGHATKSMRWLCPIGLVHVHLSPWCTEVVDGRLHAKCCNRSTKSPVLGLEDSASTSPIRSEGSSPTRALVSTSRTGTKRSSALPTWMCSFNLDHHFFLSSSGRREWGARATMHRRCRPGAETFTMSTLGSPQERPAAPRRPGT